MVFNSNMFFYKTRFSKHFALNETLNSKGFEKTIMDYISDLYNKSSNNRNNRNSLSVDESCKFR